MCWSSTAARFLSIQLASQHAFPPFRVSLKLCRPSGELDSTTRYSMIHSHKYKTLFILQVEISSLCYYDCSKRFFNSVPCLEEQTLLSLAHLAGGLNKLLPCQAIIAVEEDWEGRVVALVDPDNLQRLFQKLKTSWAALSKMTTPSTLCDNAGLFVINCRAPPSIIIDLREFKVHDADCALVGLCSVASRQRAFVIRVFQDQSLRQAYPKIELMKENWNNS